MSPSVWSKKVHNSRRNRCKYVKSLESLRVHKTFFNARLERFRNNRLIGPMLVTQIRLQQVHEDIQRLPELVDSSVQCFPEHTESGVQTEEKYEEENLVQCDISNIYGTQDSNIAIQYDGQSSSENGSVQCFNGRDCVSQQILAQKEYDSKDDATRVTFNIRCAPDSNHTAELDENNNVVTNSPNEFRTSAIDIENVACRIETISNKNMQDISPFEFSSIYIIDMKANNMPSEKQKSLNIPVYETPVCLPQVVARGHTAQKKKPSIAVMRRDVCGTKLNSSQ